MNRFCHVLPSCQTSGQSPSCSTAAETPLPNLPEVPCAKLWSRHEARPSRHLTCALPSLRPTAFEALAMMLTTEERGQHGGTRPATLTYSSVKLNASGRPSRLTLQKRCSCSKATSSLQFSSGIAEPSDPLLSSHRWARSGISPFLSSYNEMLVIDGWSTTPPSSHSSLHYND